MADTITTWTPISAPTDFRDDAVFDIDSKTKSIQVLVEQPIVAGENKSQFIKFQMGRYYDAIDLTAMQVNIVFLSPAGNHGISAAVNTEYSEDAIRFGWLVPYEACPEKGKLYFAVEFVGADYTLKTTAGCTNVLDSISDRGIVPEPVEQEWYIVLQANVATLMQETQRVLGKVEGIFNALGTPMTADTAAEMVEESAIYVYTGSETGYTYGDWYYYDGEEWISGGAYASTALVTDTTLSKAGQAADAAAVGNALADKADKVSTPSISSPEEAAADLYVSDENGNVVFEVKNGHIRTKHFDSSDINAETDTTFTEEGKPADSKAVGDAIASIEGDIQAVEESIPDVNGFSEVGTPQESTADMYICDASGNVIALFKDGHIKTKYFDSANIDVDDVPNRYIKYSKSIVSASGTQTIEIPGDWKKGDKLILHIDDGSDGFHSKYVEYYGDNVSLVERSMYVYDTTWYEVILPADKSTIKTSFNGGLWTAGTTLTFEIYKMGEIPITPKIIKVSPNGGADYTSIRDAVDSISDASSAINPYVIELYTGTYDTLSYYTDAEIGASGFVGLLIRDGISLKGIGTTPDDVVLTASLDTTKWDSTIRGQVSTLNRQGANTIENLTVAGENIRYCVHDDFFSGGADRHHVKVKDCVFVDNGLMTNRTYGMGTVSGQYIEFINCDFGNRDMVYHTNHGGRYPCMAKFENCRGHKLYLSDYGLTASSKLNKVILNNTDFDLIDILENYNEFGLTIEGSGSADAMVNAPVGHVYNLGNIAKVKTSQSITAGKAVKASGDYIALATSPEQFYGVCIGVDSKSAYIAKSGYVCSTLVGLSGLSAGDYLTVDANSTLTATGATSANAVGVVKMVADSVAYIKLIA